MSWMSPWNAIWITALLGWPPSGLAQINLHLSPNCVVLLEGVDPTALAGDVGKLVQGSGDIWVITALDLEPFSRNDQVRGVIQQYGTAHYRSHKALFLPLTENVKHRDDTLATTYAFSSAPYLMTSTDGQYLGIDRVSDLDRRPIRFVAFAMEFMDHVIAHEIFHLEDYESLHLFAQKRLRARQDTFILRFDIFKILTELRAYKREYRVHSDPEKLSINRSAMIQDIAPLIAQLRESERQLVFNLFQIRSMDAEDLTDYLANEDTIPSLEEALDRLGFAWRFVTR